MDLHLALSSGAVALEAAVTALAVLETVLALEAVLGPAAALEVLVSPVAVRLWLSLLVVKVA